MSNTLKRNVKIWNYIDVKKEKKMSIKCNQKNKRKKMKILRKKDIVIIRNTKNKKEDIKKMEVIDVSSSTDKVLCKWIDDDGVVRTSMFSVNSLMKYEIYKERNKML